MFGKTNTAAGKNGDSLKYGDKTLNWASVGQADYLIITDENEDSNIVGIGEVGLMILRAVENAGYADEAIVGESVAAD